MHGPFKPLTLSPDQNANLAVEAKEATAFLKEEVEDVDEQLARVTREFLDFCGTVQHIGKQIVGIETGMEALRQSLTMLGITPSRRRRGRPRAVQPLPVVVAEARMLRDRIRASVRLAAREHRGEDGQAELAQRLASILVEQVGVHVDSAAAEGYRLARLSARGKYPRDIIAIMVQLKFRNLSLNTISRRPAAAHAAPETHN